MARAFGNESFTFGELQTILCNVECCLNSRPLCPLSEDVDSLDALTPSNFLTGNQFVPGPDDRLDQASYSRRWQFIKKMQQEICERYKTEYLPRLLARPKWTKVRRNLELGQLVLLQEDGVNALDWQSGRISSLHPGSDGIVRVVTVNTGKGFKKRGVTKVYPLPVDATPVGAATSTL